MKKSELVEGRDYAAGSTSRHDRFRMARVTVVEVDGARQRENGTTAKGIVLLLVEAGTSWGVMGRRKVGDEFVVASAREIQQEWESYATRKAAHEEHVKAVQRERERKREAAKRASVRLRGLGVSVGSKFDRDDPVRVDDATFSIGADAMEGLLERLDPVRAAEDAIRAFCANDGRSEDEFEEVLAAVLDELRERLATSPDGYKLASCGAPQDGDPF